MRQLTPSGRRTAPARAAALGTALAVGLSLSVVAVAPAVADTHLTPIADVQGTGNVSPMVGQTVTVRGVVTADYRGLSGYNGIVVQTQGSGGVDDATPGASDGIFIFLSSNNPSVAIGDLVDVTGPVSEYFGQTQITASSAGSVVLVESGVDLPEPTPLPTDVIGDDREQFENMLVIPTGDYLVASTHQLFNFGTLWLAPGEELVKSTEQVRPGPEANAIAAENRAARILLDDGYNIRVDNSRYPGTQPYFTADEIVRNGDAVVFPEAGMVLQYGFDEWRLQPQVPISSEGPDGFGVEFDTRNPRPESAPEVGGDVRVAAFNVLNYFTTLTSENSNARGARTAAEFQRQEAKIVAAINALDADVVGLQEIENSVKLGKPLDQAVGQLVDALNAAAGAGTWDYVPTAAALDNPDITDFITNAIIFKPGSVDLVGDMITQVDESVWFNAREPLAATFDADGYRFTVVANHFKSKSGSGVEPADGQGFFNADRVNQAQALKSFAEEIAADDERGENILLLGDFNAYSQEDPIAVFADAGWTSLVDERTEGQYTYTFNGELGSLDHIIASPAIAANVTGVGVWDINAAEWGDREYRFGATDGTSVYRSSDHDPIVVGLSTEAAPVEIDIVTINDLHGRIEAGSGVGGAAVLGGLVNDVRAENPNTLFVSAGDNIGASTFTSFIQQDQPTIDVLNAIGMDVTVIGNHEFDLGRSDLDDRVIPASNFPYIAANIYERETGEPAYDEYWVTELDGVRVGFVGAITEAMPTLVTPAGIASLEFGDMTEAVNRVATQLRDGDESNGEADVIVVLVHEGAATANIASVTDDSEFGSFVTGIAGNVDAVVSGHTHRVYNHEVPVDGRELPLVVTQGGEYGSHYGRLTLSVDRESGQLVDIASTVAPLPGAAQPDPAVASIVAEAVAFAEVAGAVSLGKITSDIRRAVQGNGSENRGGSSTLGNLVADAQLWATRDLNTEVAIMNPGGLRADLLFAGSGAGDPDGNVTFREAANVQPFANSLFTMELTGAQLRSVLEEQWQPDGATRPFLKLGLSAGLEYTYDPTAPRGERISTITLNGSTVTDAQTIRIVTNSFLASGGDGFTTLAQGSNRADSGRIDLQAFVDYFAEFSPIAPDVAQRSIGVSPDISGTTLTPGDTVELQLSSLLFTNAGDRDAVVTVSIDGQVLAEAAIDPTIVDNTDEQGRATVTFTVPDGVDGVAEVVITVADNGTEVSIPVLIEAGEPLPEIEVVKAPKITGPVVVGKTATVDVGRFSVNGAEVSLQWMRDGVAIDGATDAQYTVRLEDRGASLTVEVTVTADGYETLTVLTDARRVPPAVPGGPKAIAALSAQ
ncbi:ExeM/NucH family extracellular endonuclease [Microcella sp.]|uniref:ExeM/NucH family extracellular endonuclease n=1 Tax=Microcella sp. TaxID=1913979 RepID=UPI00391DA641